MRARYDRLWKEQDGRCAICLVQAAAPRIWKEQALDYTPTLYMDHHHASGYFRGLLCPKCNPMIGQLRERADLMRRAAEYIETWGARIDHEERKRTP